MRDDFDKEAMERKIKANMDKGFTMQDIRIALREELKAVLESIQIKEARGVELSDQIEYINER